MNPEQAKAAADVIASMWENEFRATCQVIGAVDTGNREYKPDAKSRSAWEIAKHIAQSDVWFLDCITNGVFQFDHEQAKKMDAQFTSIQDVLDFYQKTFPEKLKALRAVPAEKMAESLDFMGFMKMPRSSFVAFANNHSMHHRGQLAAYLRAMGSKVPDIYGPSADSERSAK